MLGRLKGLQTGVQTVWNHHVLHGRQGDVDNRGQKPKEINYYYMFWRNARAWNKSPFACLDLLFHNMHIFIETCCFVIFKYRCWQLYDFFSVGCQYIQRCLNKQFHQYCGSENRSLPIRTGKWSGHHSHSGVDQGLQTGSQFYRDDTIYLQCSVLLF